MVPIAIYAKSETITNKLFKKILKENSFDKIDHKIFKINKLTEEHLEKTNAQLTVIMGSDGLYILDSSISFDNVVGKGIIHKNKKVMITYDLDVVCSELDFFYSFVGEQFAAISRLYFKSREKNTTTVDIKSTMQKCHSFQLPDWCYDSNHILIDIQYNKFKNKILYTFRDSNGVKKYHTLNSKETYFYSIPVDIRDSDIIKKVSEVQLHTSKSGLLPTTAMYEEDVKPDIKHSIDYYYNRVEPETNYKLKILYWDIEVYTGQHKAFPFALEAEFPINSISFKLDSTGTTYVYILKLDEMDVQSYFRGHNSLEENFKEFPEIKDYIVKVFDTESDLITSFISKTKELDPDVWAGWNTEYFDIPYLVNRLHKLGLDVDILSPIGATDVSISEYYGTTIYGLYLVDQLIVYKKLTQNVEESYKLNSISQKVLGEGKVAYEGSINSMYEGDLIKFILYSGTDTDLLAELEDALHHIDLNFELIKTCSSTWKRAETSSGLVDPLLLKFAKDKNLVCRNRIDQHHESFSGAYVLEPKVGVHKWVVDFDFASLYPSIILSLNLGPNTYKAKISENDAYLYLYKKQYLPQQIKVTLNPILRTSQDIYLSPSELEDFIITNDYIVAINGVMTLQHEKELSFFYEALTYLGNQRTLYKKKLGDLRQEVNTNTSLDKATKDRMIIEMKQYDNKQSSYKIVSNSIYGILGMPFFRMYNLELARAITSTGQEALKFSVYHLSNYLNTDDKDIKMSYLEHFEKSDLPYIAYGDTDSLFVMLGDYLQDNGGI